MNRYFPALVFLLAAFLASLCSALQLTRSGLSSEDQKVSIVKWHNHVRNIAAGGGISRQPKAENMREMVWDEELAKQAQKWADNCRSDVDPNLVNRKGEPVGQNLAETLVAKSKAELPHVEDMVKSWAEEVFKFGFNGTYNLDSGHYSQMVWGSSYKVGCGYSECAAEDSNKQLLVCNYFPAGNELGSKPYERGVPNCLEHYLFQSPNYKNLCTITKELISSCSAPTPALPIPQNLPTITPKKPAPKPISEEEVSAEEEPAPKKPIGRKPSPKKPTGKKPAPKPISEEDPDEEEEPVAKKPIAKKPAAKKPSGKKPAPKPISEEDPDEEISEEEEPVAKKPIAKKPAAKKPSGKKPAPKPISEEDPDEEISEEEEPVAKKPAARKPAGKKPAPKPISEEDPDDEIDEED